MKRLPPIKASELVKELNRFIREHGDKDVAISILEVSDPPTGAIGSTLLLADVAVEGERLGVIQDAVYGDKSVCEIVCHFFEKGHSSLKSDTSRD